MLVTAKRMKIMSVTIPYITKLLPKLGRIHNSFPSLLSISPHQSRFFFMRPLFSILCFTVVLLLLFSCLPWYTFAKPSKNTRFTKEEIAFYSAVCAVQAHVPDAAKEKMDIPAKIRRADETETLCSHPDTFFVLQHAAETLSSLRGFNPKARLFEAYARLNTGDIGNAKEVLSDYLADAPYNRAHYSILSQLLSKTQDFLSLYIIALEWEEKDASCDEERLKYLWESLFHLGRYSKASEEMEKRKACAPWMAAILAARSDMETGGVLAAEAAVAQVLDAYPNKKNEIAVLWSKLLLLPSFTSRSTDSASDSR